MTLARIGDIAEINPSTPRTLKTSPVATASFFPMSALSERGFLREPQPRRIGDLLNGFSYFESGDVILAKITPCFENGKAAFVESLPSGAGFGSTEYHVLRPGPGIDGRYLFHMIWSPQFRQAARRNMTGTAGQKRVPAEFVRRFQIPLPSKPEQRRIAAILDKADDLRQKREESIRLTDELLRSTFLEMFGDPVRNPKSWPIEQLGNPGVAEIVSGVAKGRKLDAKLAVTVPYMRVANVQDGRISLQDVKTIEATPEEVHQLALRKGDILLTEGGDPDKLGRGAVWESGPEPCIHQNHIFRVRVNLKLFTPGFLSAQLGSSRGKRYFFRAAKQTTGIASINMTQLRGFPALRPPFELQERYSRFLANQRRVEQDQLRELGEVETLFQSLLHRAFRGEL